MVTKILYVLGDGSRNGDIELRWSLRSLERNARCEVEPVIAGRVPTWFRGAALSVPDEAHRKEKNIMRAILAAADAGLVDGYFQISADDHILNRPFDLSRLPICFRQPIIPESREGDNNHARALHGTRNVLMRCGYPAINTAVHRNMWCSTSTVEAVKRVVLAGAFDPLAKEYGLVSWAVWPNVLIGSEHLIRKPLEPCTDVKIRNDPEETVRATLDTATFVSFNDDAFLNAVFTAHMYRNFDEKSKWEK